MNKNKIVRWWEPDYNQMGGNDNIYNITSSFLSRSKKFNCEQRCFEIDFVITL